jgi:LmbE family N-acetylglucosaminyl deacetylase
MWRLFYRVEVDITDYKLEKIRAIQCHASQNPKLSGRPEDVTDKIPCSELYTVARDMKTKDNYPNWFETVSEGETYEPA